MRISPFAAMMLLATVIGCPDNHGSSADLAAVVDFASAGDLGLPTDLNVSIDLNVDVTCGDDGGIIDGGSSCCTTCPLTSQATTVSCSVNGCQITACNSGNADCNGTYSDGCEANTTSDVMHCGGCSACVISNNIATASCSASACHAATCNSGYADCNGTYSDGCEANTTSDVMHCGGCSACVISNNIATASCSASACHAATCNSGYADCNGTYSDGCETNIVNNPAHCGACNFACSIGATCTNGNTCQCPAAVQPAICAGACTDLSSSNLNCGSCNHPCGSSQTCVNGNCN